MSTPTVTDIKKLVENKFEECYLRAEEIRGEHIPRIKIDWTLKGKCSGQFCYKIQKLGNRILGYSTKYFRVNFTLAKDNLDDYLSKTVVHEFSHYIQFLDDISRNRRSKPHGKEWKNIMIRYFGIVPKRCHSYNVTSSRRQYVYRCNCGEFNIGSIRHRRAQNGVNYLCAKCNNKIIWTGKMA